MRLALIGKDISHSRSPELYRKHFGTTLKYDLLDFPEAEALPAVTDLATTYAAINITSPYKEHYFTQVSIEDPTVRKLGAINTIAFNQTGAYGTNTDLLAMRNILAGFKRDHGAPELVVLGGGVMARLTVLAAKELGLEVRQLCRRDGHDMENLDLSARDENQTIVINCCSRKYVFRGKISRDHLFWDLNYHFPPHENTLPAQVKEYIDGQALLQLQADFAVDFWKAHWP